MRAALLLFAGLIMFATSTASAGVIPNPNPGDYCTPTSVCWCYQASTFEGINQGPPDMDILEVPGWYIDCSNQAIGCVSNSFISECLVG